MVGKSPPPRSAPCWDASALLDAALLEGTCNFSLWKSFLTDLPAVAASKYARTEGSLNKGSIKVMKLISHRGKWRRSFFPQL